MLVQFFFSIPLASYPMLARTTKPQTRLTTGSSMEPTEPPENTAATHSSPTSASTLQQSVLRRTVLNTSVSRTSRAQGPDASRTDCMQAAAAAAVGTAAPASAVAGGRLYSRGKSWRGNAAASARAPVVAAAACTTTRRMTRRPLQRGDEPFAIATGNRSSAHDSASY